MEPNKKMMKDVFTLVERGDKTYFVRSGRGFVNADESITVLLDVLPMSGKLQLRAHRPAEAFAPRPLFPEQVAP